MTARRKVIDPGAALSFQLEVYRYRRKQAMPASR
jgi:hypothetical protein